MEFDGSCDHFILTKPPDTGGLVTVAVAAEQVTVGLFWPCYVIMTTQYRCYMR